LRVAIQYPLPQESLILGGPVRPIIRLVTGLVICFVVGRDDNDDEEISLTSAAPSFSCGFCDWATKRFCRVRQI